MLVMSCPVQVKAVETDGDKGIVEAIVSVFGNVDSYGDVVVKGAFEDTLAEWKNSGAPIPVYWSHRMDDPDFNIGFVLEAKEVDKGLWVKFQCDLEDPTPTSKATQVFRLLKGRRVTQFSFAYDIVDAGPVTVDEKTFYELRKLKLHEVGPTPIGANQETELLAVKDAGAVARRMAIGVQGGRELPAKHISDLRAARDSIDAVLTAADHNDQEQTSGTGPANTVKSPSGGVSTAEEPRRNPSVDLRALQSIQLAALAI